MPREQLQLPDSVREKMQSIQDARKTYEEAMKAHAKSIVTVLAGEIMTAHPEIQSIRWSQYTPYFNDGDACTFGVCEPELEFSQSFVASMGELGYDKFMDEMSDGFFTIYSYNRQAPEFLKVIAKKQRDFYSVLEELQDALEDAFGDHKRITIESTGIIHVDEYRHD